MKKSNEAITYIYGRNPVKEELKIIKAGTLYLSKNSRKAFIQDVVKKAKSKGLDIVYIDGPEFEKKFAGKNHQGIVLAAEEDFIKTFTYDDFVELINNSERDKSIVLILDGVKDIGNMGAILRSALLFNVDAVILPKNNSCPVNDVVVKRSAGAALHTNILYVTNIVRVIEELKKAGYWIYAACKDGESVAKTGFNEKSVLVLGEEGRGIRDLVLKNSDVAVTIPTNDRLDSLNVSVSAGIILYEMNKA